LRKDGVLFVGPNEGDMACGEYGPGRMAEPLEIVAAIAAALESDTAIPLPPGIRARPGEPNGALAGKRVVVTSGPTHEPIDPVRYIANRSSGKQGHAIARAAAEAGADVALISGPVSLPDPPGVQTRHVETAQDMLCAVNAALPADIFVATAAVADWRMAETGAAKLKKSGNGAPKLNLVENPDILATIAHRNHARPKLVVGFAAETHDVLAHARKKLDAKGCDMIVANDVSPSTGIMGGDTNTIHIVTRDGIDSWPTLDKDEVARRLVARLARELAAE
jgi:phosphopantothenoylcysteine decarboxylase/phosphopantothenate--cysteine ligase